MIFQHGDIRVSTHLAAQRGGHRFASGVGGMNDAAMAVAAFAGQVKALIADAIAVVAIAGKRHAQLNQPVNRRARVLNNKARGLRIAQPGAGHQRILYMCFHRILIIQHRRNAALGVGGAAFQQILLGDQAHLAVFGQM